MDKSPDAFRTISEVADWLGVQAHVLRFWESKFTQVKPIKRAGGRRYYRPADMALLGGIKTLLHDEGLTIKGVQKTLREQGVAHVSELSQPLDVSAADIEGGAPRLTAEDPEPLPKVVPFQARPSEPSDTPAPEPPSPPPDLAPKAAPPPDTTGLPSFLKRPLEPEGAVSPPEDAPPAQIDEEPAPVAEAAPEPDAPRALRPRVIEAPDPPEDETALPYTPGVLARLSGLGALTPDQAAEIAPLVHDLKAWVDRVGQVGVR